MRIGRRRAATDDRRWLARRHWCLSSAARVLFRSVAPSRPSTLPTARHRATSSPPVTRPCSPSAPTSPSSVSSRCCGSSAGCTRCSGGLASTYRVGLRRGRTSRHHLRRLGARLIPRRPRARPPDRPPRLRHGQHRLRLSLGRVRQLRARHRLGRCSRRRLFLRWLGWWAVVAGRLSRGGAAPCGPRRSGLLGYFLFWVWVIALCVVLLRPQASSAPTMSHGT